MSDNLRDRIAAIIATHEYRSGFDTDCTCGIPGIWEWFDYLNHLADVLITELGLTRFDCDGQHWWATRVERDSESVEPWHGKTSGTS